MNESFLTWNALIREVSSIEIHDGREAPAGLRVLGVEYDSRRVQAGSVFVAMQGGTTDGNQYVASALGKGAAGIITDSAQTFQAIAESDPTIPCLLVEHGRTALAQASAAFYGHPERHVSATGVTGTNGKTTTAFLIESLLTQFSAGHAARFSVLVGTIEHHVAGQVRSSAHTTPESRDLFELLAEGVRFGATELVMEVSSHALDQGRVMGVAFDVAVFTNLTRDHLDYHGTMEAYFASKQLLFSGTRYPAPRVAILNANDHHSVQLAAVAAGAGSQIYTYGLDVDADWSARHIQLAPQGAQFLLESPFGSAYVQSALAGEVNVSNLLAALAAAQARGLQWPALLTAIPHLEPVPGRFQPVNAGQPFTVIVDYAHTDDALRNLTALARRLVRKDAMLRQNGRVITLFGCGGDRDRSKRSRMGRAAGEGSDLVVVTSDNPRSEDPLAIIQEILPGVEATGVPFVVEPDRKRAIARALDEGRPGDIVLIAGKGHEKEQITKDGPVFFDDLQVALSALRSLGYGGEQ